MATWEVEVLTPGEQLVSLSYAGEERLAWSIEIEGVTFAQDGETLTFRLPEKAINEYYTVIKLSQLNLFQRNTKGGGFLCLLNKEIFMKMLFTIPAYISTDIENDTIYGISIVDGSYPR